MNKKKDSIVLARRSPGKSAELFRANVRPNLINQQAEWLDWDGHAYIAVEDATINSELEQFARRAFVATAVEVGKDGNGTPIYKQTFEPFEPKPGDLVAIYDMLIRQNHKPADTMSPPCWLTPSDDTRPSPRNIISLQNGLLDIESRTVSPSTPDFFTRTALPITYDPDAPAPELWMKFLSEVFESDGQQQLIELLQEIFGYIISGDTSQQAVFFLWGLPRSGKGTILRVITELVGKLNCHNPSVHTLAGRFGLEGCLAKSLVKITDLNCDDKVALSTSVSRINAISGEDDVTVERKNIKDWDGRLPGRFLVAANRLPNFGGGSVALATRLIILPFVISFLGREDRALTEKLLAELPGILNWALDGLAKLRERGRFDEPAVSLAAKSRMLYQSDPVRGFIDDKCVTDPDAGIDKNVFYALYRAFCQEVGTHPVALHILSERLSEIYPTIYASRRRISPGSMERVPTFMGVRLNDAELIRRYKIDTKLYALGAEGMEAVMLDDAGWPIPTIMPGAFD